LFRAVDIGAELFAMSAACVRAQMLKEKGQGEAVALADTFCREARLRIAEHFRNFYGPNDENMYKLAMSVLKGEHAWLEQGITGENTEMGERLTRFREENRRPAATPRDSEILVAQ
jgi:hypothetical protein